MRNLLACLCLSACGSVVLQTAAELERMSPMDADPAMFAVAIDLPDGFGIFPESATMLVSVEQETLDQESKEKFTLQQSGQQVAVFQVAANDHSRLQALQSQAREWDAKDAEATKGSIGVDLTPCLIHQNASLSETFSVAIQLAPDAPFRPLLRDVPISRILQEQELEQLPNCP
ncbi:MAG: hypothetical protein JXQ85_11510 [Cognatishimia sp.]|uniref:hypothetical protein n=1 Tax=Cognatishimia sp. TaxID=2211648 RepID=UPI003B8AC078